MGWPPSIGKFAVLISVFNFTKGNRGGVRE